MVRRGHGNRAFVQVAEISAAFLWNASLSVDRSAQQPDLPGNPKNI
jgi:hypothetical protein